MRLEYSVTTTHTPDALREILSDPNFVLPKIFRSIKEIRSEGSSFSGTANYLGIKHYFQGNVYSSYNKVTYVFQIRRDKDSASGKLTFNINADGRLDISLEYSGFMEKGATILLKKWIGSFISNINEEIRLERIRRKI
ncbi:DUF3211 domain-containing protein [Stygiolobus azoricus]|uniref:DUF3211 domain-containing protein n=1 Tax=Stygiolobus azoricus TaxID=41675 RepID=A0A650CPE7_9CREN|nr:DUF3211 domain-containing protein [Stygiolobus azoricus]QGR19658.1 DUF3211 domain-containing protein [Stygiolobus azoricus]